MVVAAGRCVLFNLAKRATGPGSSHLCGAVVGPHCAVHSVHCQHRVRKWATVAESVQAFRCRFRAQVLACELQASGPHPISPRPVRIPSPAACFLGPLKLQACPSACILPRGDIGDIIHRYLAGGPGPASRAIS